MKQTIVLGMTAAALIAPGRAAAAGFNDLNAANFSMTRTGLDDAAYARIRALENNYGNPVGMREVVENANRTTTGASAPTPGTVANFGWDSADNDVDYWIPQGITGSSDAVGAEGNAIVGGHKEILVSWYSNNGKGGRITVVNADQLSGAKYRHILLVVPNASGNFGLVDTHAGGIAWYGNYLYVAETNTGLRVFDMRHIIKVPRKRENETLGYSYILPQAGVYTTPNNPGVVFSSVSVDRSQANHALVTSEFRQEAVGGRIFRWKINQDTGLLGPTAVALGAWKATDVPSIQGALMKGGKIGLSSSYSSAPACGRAAAARTRSSGAPGPRVRRTSPTRSAAGSTH